MTALMIDPDDGGCMAGTRLPPPPGFVQPPIAESLLQGFDDQTEFYVMDGRPIAVWPDWDYAEDWSIHPIRELHPFIPVIYGKEITEAEFRTSVKLRQGLA
jgi:hypothetical protein